MINKGFLVKQQRNRVSSGCGITTSLGYQMKVYGSSSKDCSSCPLRSVCIGKSDFKKIDDSVDKPYYDRMHQRLQTAKAKRMKKLRSSTVEPVPGTLVNFPGMRRVNTRGLQQSNKCMLMAAVAYNLKKLMKFTSRKVLADVKSLQQRLQNTFSGFIHHIMLITRSFAYYWSKTITCF